MKSSVHPRKHWSALKTASYYLSGSRFPAQGAGDEEDRRLEEELLADEKELSEHNMLVDLGGMILDASLSSGPLR